MKTPLTDAQQGSPVTLLLSHFWNSDSNHFFKPLLQFLACSTLPRLKWLPNWLHCFHSYLPTVFSQHCSQRNLVRAEVRPGHVFAPKPSISPRVKVKILKWFRSSASLISHPPVHSGPGTLAYQWLPKHIKQLSSSRRKLAISSAFLHFFHVSTQMSPIGDALPDYTSIN
jgi:hypothetical protein